MYRDHAAHLERAEALIERGELADLRYAALELRLFLEAVVYDKLKRWVDQRAAPPDLLSKWQAPQLLQALLQISPWEDREHVIAIGLEKIPGVPVPPTHVLGRSKPIGLGWLRRNYNKLGGLLHSPMLNGAKPDRDRLKPFLLETIAYLRERLEGTTTDGLVFQPIVFECGECRHEVRVSEDAIRDEGEFVARCLNPDCEAPYRAVRENGVGYLFTPLVQWYDCSCGHRFKIDPRRAAVGSVVNCPECHERYALESWYLLKLTRQDASTAA